MISLASYKGLFSSNSNEYSTPQELFALLDREFHFKLDPCAAKENAKCKKFFTIEDDGLSKDWENPTFVNPPYGNQLKLWVKKSYEEYCHSEKNECQNCRWINMFERIKKNAPIKR